MKSALIVEPDPAIRLLLLRILGRSGWQVDAVAGIEEALAFLEHEPPGIVLTDWHPEADSGLRLLTAVRTHPTWSGVPMLVMSGKAGPAEVGQALENGANDFIPKPFAGEEVLRTIDRWVCEADRLVYD